MTQAIGHMTAELSTRGATSIHYRYNPVTMLTEMTVESGSMSITVVLNALSGYNHHKAVEAAFGDTVMDPTSIGRPEMLRAIAADETPKAEPKRKASTWTNERLEHLTRVEVSA